MHTTRKTLTLAAAVFLAACGGGRGVGDTCSPEGSLTCASDKEGLFCESGKLRAAPCKGAGGCMSNSSQATCAFTGAGAGDACPKSMMSKGTCSNLGDVLTCNGTTWAVTTDCTSAQTCTAGTPYACQ